MLAIYAGICYNKYNRKTPEQQRKGDFTMAVNKNCYLNEEVICNLFSAKKSRNNESGIDGYLPDGRSVEVKTFTSSRPSLGGKHLLETERNLRKAIENYCKADLYAFFFENGTPTILTHDDAIEWLLERVILDSISKRRGGGGLKLRINKNPRTQKQTEKFIAAGFIL